VRSHFLCVTLVQVFYQIGLQFSERFHAILINNVYCEKTSSLSVSVVSVPSCRFYNREIIFRGDEVSEFSWLH
jgi:hypothetical protein